MLHKVQSGTSGTDAASRQTRAPEKESASISHSLFRQGNKFGNAFSLSVSNACSQIA
jgi:hypothetical protein